MGVEYKDIGQYVAARVMEAPKPGEFSGRGKQIEAGREIARQLGKKVNSGEVAALNEKDLFDTDRPLTHIDVVATLTAEDLIVHKAKASGTDLTGQINYVDKTVSERKAFLLGYAMERINSLKLSGDLAGLNQALQVLFAERLIELPEVRQYLTEIVDYWGSKQAPNPRYHIASYFDQALGQSSLVGNQSSSTPISERLYNEYNRYRNPHPETKTITFPSNGIEMGWKEWSNKVSKDTWRYKDSRVEPGAITNHPDALDKCVTALTKEEKAKAEELLQSPEVVAKHTALEEYVKSALQRVLSTIRETYGQSDAELNAASREAVKAIKENILAATDSPAAPLFHTRQNFNGTPDDILVHKGQDYPFNLPIARSVVNNMLGCDLGNNPEMFSQIRLVSMGMELQQDAGKTPLDKRSQSVGSQAQIALFDMAQLDDVAINKIYGLENKAIQRQPCYVNGQLVQGPIATVVRSTNPVCPVEIHIVVSTASEGDGRAHYYLINRERMKQAIESSKLPVQKA